MAIKTQGTYLFTIDPANGNLLAVGCVTSIDGVDTTNEQIETTCLQSMARTYEAGLATPGAASFGINFDDADDSHVRLHQLKVAGTTLPWVIGFSNGVALPEVNTSEGFDLPASRGWISFTGFMTSFPFTFAQNSVIQSTVGIQISGEPVLHRKTA